MRSFFRILLVALSLIVLFEVGLRVFGYGRYIIYQSDPFLLWTPIPNQRGLTVAGHHRITIDSYGLRYAETFGKRDSSEVRVFVFGDSVAMGWGVDDDSHFSAVLDRLLEEEPDGRRFRVISAGVNAYPTSLCVRRFQRLLDEGHQIDVAILAFSFNWGIEHFAQIEGEEKSKLLRKVQLKSVLRRSANYNFFIEDVLRGAVYYRLRDRLIPGSWVVKGTGESDKVGRYVGSLEKFKQIADRNGIRSAFLLLGSRNQHDLNEYQQAFLDFASEYSIPLVNIPAVFGSSSHQTLFTKGDPNHPNRAGHALIAEALLPVVKSLSRDRAVAVKLNGL